MLAARRPSWRCGVISQPALQPCQPPDIYLAQATATWTTTCSTLPLARLCPLTLGAPFLDIWLWER